MKAVQKGSVSQRSEGGIQGSILKGMQEGVQGDV